MAARSTDSRAMCNDIGLTPGQGRPARVGLGMTSRWACLCHRRRGKGRLSRGRRRMCVQAPSALPSRSASSHRTAGVAGEAEVAAAHFHILPPSADLVPARRPVHDAVGPGVDRRGGHAQRAALGPGPRAAPPPRAEGGRRRRPAHASFTHPIQPPTAVVEHTQPLIHLPSDVGVQCLPAPANKTAIKSQDHLPPRFPWRFSILRWASGENWRSRVMLRRG